MQSGTGWLGQLHNGGHLDVIREAVLYMIILKNTRHSRKEDWGCCKGAGLVHVSGVAGLTSSSTFTERISQTSRHTLRLHYKFFRAVAQKEPTRQKSTISPPPHLATSPPRHLATSPPDAQVGHLATSPFPHLTISPPRHVTISPRHEDGVTCLGSPEAFRRRARRPSGRWLSTP